MRPDVPYISCINLFPPAQMVVDESIETSLNKILA